MVIAEFTPTGVAELFNQVLPSRLQVRSVVMPTGIAAVDRQGEWQAWP